MGKKHFTFAQENLPDIRGTVHRKNIYLLHFYRCARNRGIWFRGVSDSAGYDPAGSLVQPVVLRPRWISRKALGACHCLPCVNSTKHDLQYSIWLRLSSPFTQFFFGWGGDLTGIRSWRLTLKCKFLCEFESKLEKDRELRSEVHTRPVMKIESLL